VWWNLVNYRRILESNKIEKYTKRKNKIFVFGSENIRNVYNYVYVYMLGIDCAYNVFIYVMVECTCHFLSEYLYLKNKKLYIVWQHELLT